MEWYVRAFLKASLSWLALGVTLGVVMAARPAWTIYRVAHVHMVLLGFVTMMIFGVGYHVIPRFAGAPLRSRRAAVVHWWMSNLGLTGLVAGFSLRPHGAAMATPVLVGGGVLSALGAYTFVVLLWRSIDGPERRREVEKRTSAPSRERVRVSLPLASTAMEGTAAGR